MFIDRQHIEYHQRDHYRPDTWPCGGFSPLIHTALCRHSLTSNPNAKTADYTSGVLHLAPRAAGVDCRNWHVITTPQTAWCTGLS